MEGAVGIDFCAPKAGALPGCATPRHEVPFNYSVLWRFLLARDIPHCLPDRSLYFAQHSSQIWFFFDWSLSMFFLRLIPGNNAPALNALSKSVPFRELRLPKCSSASIFDLRKRQTRDPNRLSSVFSGIAQSHGGSRRTHRRPQVGMPPKTLCVLS
jgi:hypothetical protein